MESSELWCLYNAATSVLHTHSLWANVRILLAMNPLLSLLMAGVYSDQAWFYVLVLLIFLCMIGYPDKKQLRRERIYLTCDSRLHSIIVGKLRQQCQTADHVTSTVKNREK